MVIRSMKPISLLASGIIAIRHVLYKKRIIVTNWINSKE